MSELLGCMITEVDAIKMEGGEEGRGMKFNLRRSGFNFKRLIDQTAPTRSTKGLHFSRAKVIFGSSGASRMRTEHQDQIDKKIVMKDKPIKDLTDSYETRQDGGQVRHKLAAKSSIHDHLIKLIMFLLAVSWPHSLRAHSQKQYAHTNNQFGQQSHHHLALGERRNLGLGSTRPTNANYQHFSQITQQRHYQPSTNTGAHLLADRRASGGGSGGGSGLPNVQNKPQASQHESSDAQRPNNGRLLVCYYTTRQSATHWPRDAREFAVPPEGMNLVQSPNDLSFAPTDTRYDLSLAANVNSAGPQQQVANQDFGYANLNTKNQQQQLVFKSATLQPAANGADGGGIAVGRSANSIGIHNNGANKNKQHLQETVSQMLAAEHLQYQHPMAQQTLVFAEPVEGSHSNGRNKQTPAYSFIGDLDSVGNNGLIVGGASINAEGNSGAGGTIATPVAASAAPMAQSRPTTVLGHNGNNGNNFIINKDSNNGHHQDRNPMKQAQTGQQLVFSPPLSRAFVAGANVGLASSNNEILDTKSQLFIPTGGNTNNNNNNNNSPQHQHHYHQQTAAPAGHQLESQLGGTQKGTKGVQVAADQLSHANMFSVPKQLPQPASLHEPSPGSSGPFSAYRNSLQQSLSPTASQLILNGGNSGTSGGGATSNTHNVALKSPTSGANSPSGSKLKYASLDDGGDRGEISHLSFSSSPSSSASSSSSSSSSQPSSAASPSLGGPSSSTPQAQPSPPKTPSIAQAGALSSALVSSPLSTMFDVFGAASQYLMRLKPSSLISPSSFTFNTIQNDHRIHRNQHQSPSKTQTNSSSLLGSLASSVSANSLLPLPFSSSLISSIQQKSVPPASSSAVSSQSSSSSDRSSASGATSGSGFLSRFANLQNNQRREDVCGRTIQTPQRRIIGGEGARYGEFPYQVHIKIAKHQCGGALVDKQSIVTAAHCVYHFITRAPVNKLQIVIGAYDIEDEQYQELPPQYFKVNKVKLHPNFRFSASHPDRYDVAILKLDKPVKYTDNVLPVCLPGKDLKIENSVGTVTGFGKTDPSLSNRYGTRLLQKVDVPIIENNECERWHRTRGIDLKIFPEMMCAGYEDGLKDACVGDSGGPLVVKTASGPNGAFRWTLAGITSAGFGCAQSRQPGIYHRVSHTVDWILENLD